MNTATSGRARFRLLLVSLAAVVVLAGVAPSSAAPPSPDIALEVLGTYTAEGDDIFDTGAAEIVKYDERTQRLFAVNAEAGVVDVIDVSDPTAPTLDGTIDPAPDVDIDVGGINSVAVHRGVVALAVEAAVSTDPGVAAFYAAGTLAFLGSVPAGALPDMITFTPNGQYALVANEGEPNHYLFPGDDDFDPADPQVDPEGSVTVIEIKANFQSLSAVNVGFGSFDGQEADLLAAGVRIFGPGATVAQDFEPEFITVADNNQTAYVSLQENNAIAVLDLTQMAFTDIWPLGYKDHSLAGNGIDANDDDEDIDIRQLPVFGMYQPDGLASYMAGGRTYIVSANEGDAREYDGFEEEIRVEDLILDPDAFPNLAGLLDETHPDFIGRLNVTSTLGVAADPCDGDDCYEALYAFGARSFSIWDTAGSLVFDSGDQFEQITADALPDDFNSDNDENDSFDSRSDSKGPEPEGVVLGQIGGNTFAFIGLERIGGIMVYDITDPMAPEFKFYINNRDFTGDAEAGTAGDLGPEGLAFIPAAHSPIGEPMLAAGNEVSGTTTLYRIVVD